MPLYPNAVGKRKRFIVVGRDGNPIDMAAASEVVVHLRNPHHTDLKIEDSQIVGGAVQITLDNRIPYAGTYRVQIEPTIFGASGRSSTASFVVDPLFDQPHK